MKIHLVALACAISTAAMAHISIDEPRGAAGATYQGVLRVGHGCNGSATTGITLQLPAEVTGVSAKAAAGWSVSTTPSSVTWKAQPGVAIGSSEKGEFPLAMKLPAKTGALWLKAEQACEKGSIQWADVPSQGTSTAGMKTPALLVEVMSPADLALARAMPAVDGGWVRATVPGQQASGAFMRITAREPMTLVGAASPIARSAEVHEMKMEGDVMRMRPAGAIALQPGRTLDLKPGGYHLMLQDLKGPIKPGTSVPVTLQFRDAKGAERRLEVELPALQQAPTVTAAPASGTQMHKH